MNNVKCLCFPHIHHLKEPQGTCKDLKPAFLCQFMFNLSAATLVCAHRALLQREDRREQSDGEWQRALFLQVPLRLER